MISVKEPLVRLSIPLSQGVSVCWVIYVKIHQAIWPSNFGGFFAVFVLEIAASLRFKITDRWTESSLAANSKKPFNPKDIKITTEYDFSMHL